MSSSSSSSAAPYAGTIGVHLQREVQERFQTNVVDGFRWKVTAVGATGMTDHIFRYIRRPLDVAAGTVVDEFDGVCSPPDLEEFGENNPIPDREPKFLRLNYIDLVFRSQHEAEEAWTAVVEDVSSLVATLKIMEQTIPAQTLAVGDPDDL